MYFIDLKQAFDSVRGESSRIYMEAQHLHEIGMLLLR